MKAAYLTAIAAAALVTTGVSASTVYNTSLQDVSGTFGTSTATTTTDATGTRTVVTGPGPNSGANRASGVGVLNQWFQANVGAGSTVGITTDHARDGNGSAYFEQTQEQTGKADLVYLFETVATLSNLTSLSFDFFRDASSTTDPNLAPVLRLGILKDGVWAGTLVLENVYQQQLPAPTGSWRTLTADLNSGIFWATNGSLGPTFADANGGQKTLADWIADNGGAILTVYGLEIGFGSGWGGTFSGAVDNVNVAFGNTVYNSNFEVDANGAVPEPATWAMMMMGFGLLGASLRRRKASIRFA